MARATSWSPCSSSSVKILGAEYHHRILSDASGPFFTIVDEVEAPSLAEWETVSRRVYSTAEFQPWFAKWLALVESGHREFYNVES